MIPIDEPHASWLLLLARILISLVFLISSIHKSFRHKQAVEEFQAAKAPLVGITLPATIGLQFGGSICLIAGIYVAEAALLLALFTLLATERAHGFWRFEGGERLERGRAALANLSIIGGLLILAVLGPGNLAIAP